jgi:phosphoribosyl 1,2-cyclic phosphate phosphodiesterase
MTGRLRFTILGCGASPGVPRIGNDWGACDPAEPRNRRTRCSLLIERVDAATGRRTTVLIDTGPDVREQLLSAGVNTLDGVIYTHAHADHVHGIDDLRAFWQNTGRLVDVYSDAATQERLDQAFGYCFRTASGSNYPPILRHHLVTPGTPVTITGDGGPITLLPLRQIHGDIDTLAIRVGGLAYSCDVSDVPADTIDALTGLDVWIVDALRYKPHPSHFTVAEAVEWIGRLKPCRAVLTHLHSDLDYATLRAELPEGIEPGFDGMVLEASVP